MLGVLRVLCRCTLLSWSLAQGANFGIVAFFLGQVSDIYGMLPEIEKVLPYVCKYNWRKEYTRSGVSSS